MADTRIGKIGLTPKGAWVSTDSYEILDVVLSAVEDGGDGCSYTALKPSQGVRPGTDSTIWLKSSQAGQSIYDLAVKYHHFEGTEEEFEAEYQAVLQAARDAAAGASAVESQVEEAEAARVAAENARVSAEAERANAETARQTAETSRATAETARQSAESNRASAETTRQSAETTRESAETTRQSNESARASAELTRTQQFQALQTDMQTAIQNVDAKAAEIAEDIEGYERNEAGRVSAEQGRVAAETARAQQSASDHTRAESDHTTATSDHQQAGSDHTRAEADHTTASEDHTTAASDHSTAGTDHTRAEQDHTTAESDHGTAESDHTRAESDHAIVQGYDTRLTNVEGEVSQLGQEVDDLDAIVDEVIEYSTSPSPNLFNKATIHQGYAVSANSGNLFAEENTAASDYIEIPSGAASIYLTTLRAYGSAGWAVYDAAKAFVRGANNTNQISVQNGDAYIRFSLLVSNVDSAMVIVGTSSDVPGQYVPYGDIIHAELKDTVVTTQKIAEAAITAPKIAPDAVTKDKADFIIKTCHASKNLLNPSECVNGAIRFSNGSVEGGPSTPRYATGFIPIDAAGIYVNCFNSYGTTTGWAVYDANKNYIRGAAQNPNTAYTYQSGDAFIRLTINTSGLGSLYYVVKATDPHEYTPYFEPYYTYHLAPEIKLTPETKLPAYEPASSLTGFLGVGQNALTLANSTVTLEDCPQYLKRQFNLSFAAKISTFENVDIGVGKDTFNGTFLRVDATNIYLCRYYNGNVSVSQPQVHGLTIGDFINISAIMDDGILTARIGTISGIFTHSFNRLGDVDSYGKPFVTASANSALTNYEFRYAGTEFRKPIWVIGDSYTSWYGQRWPVQMIDTMGVKSFMLDGFAGGTSAGMFEELQKLLVYGTPKFLLWCLGMNDSYTNWQKTFDQLLALCEEKGITLVPQTIPWPDGDNKSEINAAIVASGLRYLNGYASVSSDNNGTWYPDYSEDGVHTSVIGAKAMASRFLSDFPEFLQ